MGRVGAVTFRPMATRTGLDRLVAQDFAPLKGRAIGVVCNQASVALDLRHITEHLMPLHGQSQLKVAALFGPQHGLWGHTQDNMIEWEGGEGREGIPVYSLYGEHREPTDDMLRGVELLVIDLQDVGARYYTFIWTMALCLKACERLGTQVLVLDRPNPLNGQTVQGTVLEEAFASFVGLFPLPIRHGMTIGEVAVLLQQRHFPSARVEVVRMEGWDRSMYFDQTGLPWAMPSPNMPTPDTAIVYPGGCLIEGTKLSEGRGTTRPFEIFGAPYVDGWELSRALNEIALAGAHFRPVQFQPTFHKFVGEICEGGFLHVTDRSTFDPVLAYAAAFQEIVRRWRDRFEWRDPPYEYEYRLPPIDILAGNSWLRQAVERLEPLDQIQERMRSECDAFAEARQAALLY